MALHACVQLVGPRYNGRDKEPQPILLGITKASSETEALFLLQVFQETTRVLSGAAIDDSQEAAFLE